jgi:hypothetical protein
VIPGLAEPMSQCRTGSPAGACGEAIPETYWPFQVPARLSQKTLLNIFGSLQAGEPAGRVACNWSLLGAVDSPAGAALPLLVAAVAVVTFFMTVLFTSRTFVESSSAMPPPSWVEMLSTTMLLTIEIGTLPACSNRMPPPSSFARLSWIRFSWTET